MINTITDHMMITTITDDMMITMITDNMMIAMITDHMMITMITDHMMITIRPVSLWATITPYDTKFWREKNYGKTVHTKNWQIIFWKMPEIVQVPKILNWLITKIS